MNGSRRAPDEVRAEQARRRLLAGVDVDDRRLRLAGIETAVLEAGRGSPVVLLHGPGEFAERWARVIPGLAARHRVIAPDLPGHGRSGIGGGLDAESAFAWLDALIDECGSPPTVVGHILGGSFAARYAARHPRRVGRLVLVDTLGLARFRPSPRFALGLIGFVARPSDRSHGRFMQQCLDDPVAVADALGDGWEALRTYSVDRARDPGVKAAMKMFMSELGVPRISDDELAAIDAPVTLVWGRGDRANRLRIAEAASQRWGWPLHVIDGAADDPPMERPDDLVAAIETAGH